MRRLAGRWFVLGWVALVLALPAGAPARPAPTDPRLLYKAVQLRVTTVSVVRNGLPALCGARATVAVKNVSSRPVSLYLDECGICFWLVSIDGRPFQPLLKAMHSAPCRHRTLVTLAPGASRSVSLVMELSGQGENMRIGYQASAVGSFLPLLVTQVVSLR